MRINFLSLPGFLKRLSGAVARLWSFRSARFSDTVFNLSGGQNRTFNLALQEFKRKTLSHHQRKFLCQLFLSAKNETFSLLRRPLCSLRNLKVNRKFDNHNKEFLVINYSGFDLLGLIRGSISLPYRIEES